MGHIEVSQQQGRGERFPIATHIPDPLEGIVQGNNRFERYRFFVHDIVGQIWPFYNDPNGKEQPSPYSRYIWSAREPNNQYTSHNMVPDAADVSQITPEEFELVVNHAGPDYVRTRFISRSLLEHLKSGRAVISGGGSCIAETGDMTVINLLKDSLTKRYGKLTEKQYQLLSWLGKEIVQRNPTMTQISGASLGGQDALVLLVESDMWSDTFASLGLPKKEALAIVLNAYERIYDSFQRRSRLINPNSTVVPVNFDELDLLNRVKDWLQSFGAEWDEQIRVFEVIFTYGAQTMPDAIKQALFGLLQRGDSSKNRTVIEKWLSSDMWARVKQTDHFIAEENSGVPLEEIQKPIDAEIRFPRRFDLSEDSLSKFSIKKREDYQLKKNHHASLIKMLRWIWNQYQNNGGIPGIGALGFADLPGPHNYVAHQFPDWGGPIGDLIQEIGWASDLDVVKTILLRYLDSEKRLHRNNFDRHFSYLERFSSLAVPIDENRLFLLSQITSVEQQKRVILSQLKETSDKKRFSSETQVVINVGNGDEQVSVESAVQILSKKIAELGKAFSLLPRVEEMNPFPLNENPFIHHAMQFLWDPDFCLFIKQALDIQNHKTRETKEQAKLAMKNLMQQLLSKLKAYYGHFYGLPDYEEEALRLRHTRLLK